MHILKFNTRADYFSRFHPSLPNTKSHHWRNTTGHGGGVCSLGGWCASVSSRWDACLLGGVWPWAVENLLQPPSVNTLQGGAASSAPSSFSVSFLRKNTHTHTKIFAVGKLFGDPSLISAVLPLRFWPAGCQYNKVRLFFLTYPPLSSSTGAQGSTKK